MGAVSLAAVYCQVFKAKVGAKMPKYGEMLPEQATRTKDFFFGPRA